MTHPNVTVIDHALAQHKLTLMRNRELRFPEFRQLMREISLILGVEAMKKLPVMPALVETPFSTAEGAVLVNPSLVIIPILRAGLVMADAFQELVPTARIGHLGLFRGEVSAGEVKTYIVSIPYAPETAMITEFVVVDSIIATGSTMRRAMSILREQGINGQRITVVSVVAAAQGLEAFFGDPENADVRLFVAAIDPELNSKGYVVPGFGDSGDRQFGTEKIISLNNR